MRTTIAGLLRNQIYAFVYGAEGVGKTLLAMTLAEKDGKGAAIITADPSGPTSIVSMGYRSDLPVELLPPSGQDPFVPAVQAVEAFTRDKTVKVISVDGLSVICGRAVDHLSGGEGEKALGWDGWGQVLAGFRRIEAACENATRQGKSIILTAWEQEPVYEDSLGGKVLKSEGKPWLQGKAQTWMPGNCDIVARMTSKWEKKSVNGKVVKEFHAYLHTKRDGEWKVKSRWNLPDPCPADLSLILSMVKKGQVQSTSPVQMDGGNQAAVKRANHAAQRR